MGKSHATVYTREGDLSWIRVLYLTCKSGDRPDLYTGIAAGEGRMPGCYRHLPRLPDISDVYPCPGEGM